MVEQLYKQNALDQGTCLPKLKRLPNEHGSDKHPSEVSAQSFDKQVCLANDQEAIHSIIT